MNTTTDSVRLVIYNQNEKDKFLVLSEVDDPENFKLPGGRFNDENETPDEVASREIQEEIGLTAKVTNLTFCGELIGDDGLSKRFIYKGVADPDNIKKTKEVHTILWANEETLPESKNRHHMLTAVDLSKK